MERGFLSQKGSGGGRWAGRRVVTMKASEVSNIERPFKDKESLNLWRWRCKQESYEYLYFTGGNGIDVVVPVESIKAISERFVNTVYGFFLGKRVAYPVVANYVRNTWGKFGLVKSMLNSSTGLFSFQFSSMDGLNSMLEIGPWFICNHPLILRKWNPDVDLLKDDVGNVPVWVKLYGVPITAFSKDGLSVIATKLGNPLIFYSYTSNMCLQSWGRSSHSRVMIEHRADMELKDNIVVAMPKIMGGPSDNKKRGVTHTNEVSNSNPFDVLNSVDNDVEFGTNGGTTNLVNNGVNLSGSSFMNVENSSTCTPIINKIRKFKDLLIDGQAILVDEVGNPRKRKGRLWHSKFAEIMERFLWFFYSVEVVSNTEWLESVFGLLKNNFLNTTGSYKTLDFSSRRVVDAQVTVNEAKTADCTCYLELTVPSRSRRGGCWDFYDRCGNHYGDGIARPLLPSEGGKLARYSNLEFKFVVDEFLEIEGLLFSSLMYLLKFRTDSKGFEQQESSTAMDNGKFKRGNAYRFTLTQLLTENSLRYLGFMSTSASGSQPSGNTKKDKIQQTQSRILKNKVEAHPRKVKSSLKNKDHVVEPKGTDPVQHSKLNANSDFKCVKFVKKNSKKKVWKLIGKVFTNIGYIWRPTGQTFTIVGNACPLTRITTTTEVPLRKSSALDNKTPKPVVTLVYSRKPRKSKTSVPINNYKVVQIVLWYLDSGCSKHMTGDRSQLTNFVNKFLGTVKFGNDHVAKIMGYGDYQIGNVTISRVYYVEGLGHNLFSVGQFCDSNLEVAFRQHTCYIRNLEGVDLLTGSRGDNLYTLSLGDMMASSPICLLSKASKTKSWLWHRRLSHLNFGAINHLARHGLVRGLPKLKFEKDHLCSACALGKSTKKPHKPKSEDTNQEKLYLLHMDLCGPMRVASVNGRNNGTEFVNQTLREYYEKVGISHETSVARSPQQNGVVKRRNLDTPMVEKSKLDEDKDGKAVDPSHYRGMIGTLLYLIATFIDADHAGYQDTRRGTSGGMQFLGDRLINWSSKRSKHIDIRFHFIKEHVENGRAEEGRENCESSDHGERLESEFYAGDSETIGR
ncbi:retrovirus-related pol polyprotein from transposon TNT 1-94 [Tanacetum coccineum]